MCFSSKNHRSTNSKGNITRYKAIRPCGFKHSLCCVKFSQPFNFSEPLFRYSFIPPLILKLIKEDQNPF